MQICVINEYLGTLVSKSKQIRLWAYKNSGLPRCLGGSTNESLLLIQVMIAGSWDRVSLQASHSAEINRMHTDYGIQHASLVEETSRLKEKLSQTQAALDAERYLGEKGLH